MWCLLQPQITTSLHSTQTIVINIHLQPLIFKNNVLWKGHACKVSPICDGAISIADFRTQCDDILFQSPASWWSFSTCWMDFFGVGAASLEKNPRCQRAFVRRFWEFCLGVQTFKIPDTNIAKPSRQWCCVVINTSRKQSSGRPYEPLLHVHDHHLMVVQVMWLSGGGAKICQSVGADFVSSTCWWCMMHAVACCYCKEKCPPWPSACTGVLHVRTPQCQWWLHFKHDWW